MIIILPWSTLTSSVFLFTENFVKMAKAGKVKTPWMNFVADFRVKNATKFKSKPAEVFVAAGKLQKFTQFTIATSRFHTGQAWKKMSDAEKAAFKTKFGYEKAAAK
jgi:hypothetical protein